MTTIGCVEVAAAGRVSRNVTTTVVDVPRLKAGPAAQGPEVSGIARQEVATARNPSPSAGSFIVSSKKQNGAT
jgi:hypothetical protein